MFWLNLIFVLNNNKGDLCIDQWITETAQLGIFEVVRVLVLNCVLPCWPLDGQRTLDQNKLSKNLTSCKQSMSCCVKYLSFFLITWHRRMRLSPLMWVEHSSRPPWPLYVNIRVVCSLQCSIRAQDDLQLLRYLEIIYRKLLNCSNVIILQPFVPNRMKMAHTS